MKCRECHEEITALENDLCEKCSKYFFICENCNDVYLHEFAAKWGYTYYCQDCSDDLYKRFGKTHKIEVMI